MKKMKLFTFLFACGLLGNICSSNNSAHKVNAATIDFSRSVTYTKSVLDGKTTKTWTAVQSVSGARTSNAGDVISYAVPEGVTDDGSGGILTISGTLKEKNGENNLSVTKDSAIGIPVELRATGSVTVKNSGDQASRFVNLGVALADDKVSLKKDGNIIAFEAKDLHVVGSSYYVPLFFSGGEGKPTTIIAEYTIAEETHTTAIAVSPKDSSVYVGETVQLNAEVTPIESTDPITWESSDESIATVDKDGKVTAISKGSATITVTSNGISDTAQIVVNAILATDISLNKTSGKLLSYKTDKLIPTLTPANSTDVVTYVSSDETVAKVNANGVVEAISKGKATITATANGHEAKCEYLVVENPNLGFVANDYASLEDIPSFNGGMKLVGIPSSIGSKAYSFDGVSLTNYMQAVGFEFDAPSAGSLVIKATQTNTTNARTLVVKDSLSTSLNEPYLAEFKDNATTKSSLTINIPKAGHYVIEAVAQLNYYAVEFISNTQLKAQVSLEKKASGNVDVRLVGMINDIEGVSSVGIAFNHAGLTEEKTYETTQVYGKVLASDQGLTTEVTASELGCTYLFALTIQDVPLNIEFTCYSYYYVGDAKIVSVERTLMVTETSAGAIVIDDYVL